MRAQDWYTHARAIHANRATTIWPGVLFDYTAMKRKLDDMLETLKDVEMDSRRWIKAMASHEAGIHVHILRQTKRFSEECLKLPPYRAAADGHKDLKVVFDECARLAITIRQRSFAGHV
jgi:hypothetical protein